MTFLPGDFILICVQSKAPTTFGNLAARKKSSLVTPFSSSVEGNLINLLYKDATARDTLCIILPAVVESMPM
jgi:hypothetical protein